MTELVKYEAAERAIAAAEAVDEVLEIRSQATAWAAYAKQAKNRSLEIKAARIRFRAERKLGEMLAAQKEASGLHKGGRPEKTRSDAEQVSDVDGGALAQAEADLAAFNAQPLRITLQEAGIDRKLSSRAQKLAAMDMAEFEHALARHKQEMESGAGRVAMDLLKIDAEEKGRIHRRDLASALSSASAVAPDGRLYPALLCDPPWHRKAGIGNRAYENHYPTMPWPEILDYLKRAGEALLPDAWAWMWIPRAHLLAKVPFKTEVMLADGELVIATLDLPLAYACQLALGMDAYSTCYVWTKTDAEHPDVSGSGLLVWDQDELLLQFKRGRGLPKPESSEKFGSNHRERPREHSRKPDHYRHMIATMVGKDSDGQPLPVLELFARVDAEHPLPQNWEAWGNQAGVSLRSSEISTTTDAAHSPSSAGATSEIAGDAAPKLWDHAAIASTHVVSMTREYPGDEILSVATCQCGWTFRADALVGGVEQREDAVDNHWLDVIAQHDSNLAVVSPSGEVTAAAADATSDRASAAAAVSDFSSIKCVRGKRDLCDDTERCLARGDCYLYPFAPKRAAYDTGDVVTIDQLAGSEWLAPSTEAAPFDPASLPERESLTILSDFCHKRRDIAPALGELYFARGLTYQGAKEWSLTGKGWDRLRELQAQDAPAAPPAALTEPYRAPQPSLFDVARQLDDAPPAEIVDGILQTRLPVDDDELAEQLALISVDAGADVASDMLRHLVGKGFAHCGTTAINLTDDRRAFLAQLVAPASIQQQGAAQ